MSDRTAPPDTASPAPPKRRGRKRRFAARMAVVLLLLLVATLIALLAIPVPIPGLRERIETELRARLEAAVEIERAHFWLYERQVRVSGVTIAADTPEPLRIETIDLDLLITDWRPWRFDASVHQAHASGVRGAELIFDTQGLRQRGIPQRLLTWPGREERQEQIDLDRLRMPDLEISDAEVIFTEERPEGDVTFLRFEGLGLEVFTGEGGAFQQATIGGEWSHGEEAHLFRVSVERTGERELSLVGFVEEFDTAPILLLPGDLHLVGETLHLNTVIDLTPGAVAIESDLRGDEVEWAVRSEAVDPSLFGVDLSAMEVMRESRPHAHVVVRLDQSQERWVLEQSTLQLGESTVTASGHIERTPGLPMDLRLTTEDAPVLLEMLDLLMRSYGLRLMDGRLALELRVRGPSTEPSALRMDSQMALHDAEILGGVTRPIRGEDFGAQMRFERRPGWERFEILGGEGTMSNVHVRVVSGEIIRGLTSDGGHLFRGSLGLAASGEAQDILDHFPEPLTERFTQTPQGHFELEAEVAHTILLDQPLAESWSTPPSVTGDLRLRDVSFELADWPGEVRIDLLGLAFDTAHLWAREVEATHDGHTLSMAASVDGVGHFWRQPRFALDVSTELGAREAFDRLPPETVTLPVTPEGRVRLGLIASGMLEEPGTWQRAGVVEPRGLGLNFVWLDQPKLVVLESGRLTAEPDAIRLENLAVDANGFPFALEGEAEPGRAFLRASFDTRFEAFKEAWRESFTLFEVAGPITGEVTADLALPSSPEMDMTDAATLQALWQTALPAVMRHFSGEHVPGLTLAGVLHGSGVEFTPIMAPARITDVHGTATWDGHLFHLADITGRVASDQVELISMTADVINPSRVDGRLRSESFDLTPWIADWQRPDWADLSREERRRRAYSSEENPDLHSEIHLDLEIVEPRWRGLRGALSRGAIHNVFDRPSRQSSVRIELDPLRGYGGEVAGHFTAVSLDEGASNEVALRVSDFDINPFLADLLEGDAPDLTGQLAGDLLLRKAPGSDWREVTGEGLATVQGSNILESRLLGQVERVLPGEGRLGQSTVSSNLRVGDQRVSLEPFAIDGAWVDVEGEGWIGFDREIFFDLQIEAVPQMVEQLPVASTLAGWFNAALNAWVLSATVEGTLDDPQLRMRQPLVDSVATPLWQGVGSPVLTTVTSPLRWALGGAGSPEATAQPASP